MSDKINYFKKIKIGSLLLESKLITDAQLDIAMQKQKETKQKIGKILIGLGFVKENEMLAAIANQLKIPLVDLEFYKVDPNTVRKIPESIARKNHALLIDDLGPTYLVGMADPENLMGFDEIRSALNKPITLCLVKESDLLGHLDAVYRNTSDLLELADEIRSELETTNEVVEELIAGAKTAPVVKMLDNIFEEAMQLRASDVHIEPDGNVLRVRFRVDGVLNEKIIDKKDIGAPLVSRIKLISNLDISEKRLPQDGRFFLNLQNRHVDVRVSTMPVRDGESVVMRLLDQSQGVLRLSELGMPDTLFERVKFLAFRPGGMILVTGPTGSGKTTTLYSILAELNDKSKKIITIEDPVEYAFDRVNQVQINTNIGLTFSGVLRSALRQDPDIVLVGEMRDEETVSIGLRSAMTGHVVLSTLHTNGAIDSVMRLIDMGAESFLIASALRGIIAQRLVRKNCVFCAKDYTPSLQEQKWLTLLLNEDSQQYVFKKGEGCKKCNHTGYFGRLGVFELLEMSSDLADLLADKKTKEFKILAKSQKNFKTLGRSVFEHATQGETSLEELLRIVGDSEKGVE